MEALFLLVIGGMAMVLFGGLGMLMSLGKGPTWVFQGFCVAAVLGFLFIVIGLPFLASLVQ